MWQRHASLTEKEQSFVNMSSEEFHEYMYTKYPEMFEAFIAKPKPGEPIHPAAFGFEINRGWYHVLATLCERLELIRLLTGVTVKFVQIKEKFGDARFYYNTHIADDGVKLSEEDTKTAMDIADLLVEYYESYTQYVCGELGTNVDRKVRTGSWMHDCGFDGFVKRWEGVEGDDSRIAIAKDSISVLEMMTGIREDIARLDDDRVKVARDHVAKLLRDQVAEYKAKYNTTKD